MKRRTRVYVGGTVLLAGALSAVIAAGGNAAEPSPANVSPQVAQANQAVSALLARGTQLTTDEAAALQSSPAVTAINGDLSRARSITPPPGAKQTPWFVVPASDGSGSACIDVGEEGVACGKAEHLATTGIGITRIKQPTSAPSPYAPGGRAYVSGIVPSNVVSIAVLNTSGRVTKQVDVVGQAYRLDIATEDFGSVEYRDSQGRTTAVTKIAG